MIKSQNSRFYFLIGILIFIGALSFLILKPFIITLVLGVIFSIILYPLYEFFLKEFKNRKSIAALVTLLVTCLCIILPLSLIFSRIFLEFNNVYLALSTSGFNFDINSVAEKVSSFLNGYIPGSENYVNSFVVNINTYVKNALTFVLRNFGSIFSTISEFIIHFLIFLMSLYFLFINGPEIKRKIIEWSPLYDDENSTILTKIKNTINAVVKGTFGTMIVQGVVASIGFLIFGVPNAILWGSLCTFAAIIPSIGTYIILVPAIIYLFAIGNSTQALGLLIWAIVAVNSIDNFLSPFLSSKGTGLNSLITLLSVFGGLALFGITGIILGPIVVSIFFVFLNVHINSIQKS